MSVPSTQDQSRTAPADQVIKEEDIIVTNGLPPMKEFTELEFRENLFNGIFNDYEHPSKIQQYAIPVILEGRDLVMQSQSGSGKTMAFLIPLLQMFDLNVETCQGLVLLHTRELARQTADAFDQISGFMGEATRLLCLPDIFGETKKKFFIGTVKSVLTTLQKAIQANNIDLTKIKYLVIDEADVLLDDSDKNNPTSVFNLLMAIRKMLPSTIQTILISATFPKTMETHINSFVKPNHCTIRVNEDKTVPTTIRQLYIPINKAQKNDAIVKVIRQLGLIAAKQQLSETVNQPGDDKMSQALIFTNTKEDAENVCGYLNQNGIPTGLFMAFEDKSLRDNIFDKFREGEIQIIVCTNVMARGIDILTVNFVINYELPITHDTHVFDVSTYIHRAGRTGRIGFKGLCLSFVEERQQKTFENECKLKGSIVDKFDMDYVGQISHYLEENEKHNKELRKTMRLDDY
ncbi:ATP-dependent RNA helicase [Entamoeba marina]